jgi:hypothetical protein
MTASERNLALVTVIVTGAVGIASPLITWRADEAQPRLRR